jgi:putative molybdopterin biosynthesis protein
VTRRLLESAALTQCRRRCRDAEPGGLGVTISTIAKAAGLGFLPLAEKHYDFALSSSRKDRAPVQAFLTALKLPSSRTALEKAGFRPA